MIRLLLLLAAIVMGSTPGLAADGRDFTGVWLFDDTGDNPGVTMVEIEATPSGLAGAVTTQWYGPIAMERARIVNGALLFDIRNLNDRDFPTHSWTLRPIDGGVQLTGDIWASHVEATGYRGTVQDAEARAFPLVPLPPFSPVAQAPLAATPPMGWSSWNKFGENIDDATIRAMADAMVSTGLRDAGYIYVNIDDGWQGTRDAQGRIRPNRHFPDMKALADYVHARGLKLGIYSSQGPRTCAGFEGSYGHVQQDAQTFADWGIDYLKYDLCSGEYFYATADTVKRSYAEMGAALLATGRPMIYSLCEYGRFDVGSWGRSVGGHLWRTTGDITDEYKVMAKIGFDHNGDPAHSGPQGFNDPDMLEVGNGGMSLEEYRTHMTLWAMSAAPLLMGHDLRTMSAETLALLTNRAVIAVDQDALAIQGHAVRKVDQVEIWAKPLADGSVAIALFNRGTEAATATALPADAGLTAIAKAQDLWTGQAVKADDLRFAIPAHGTVMLKVAGRS